MGDKIDAKKYPECAKMEAAKDKIIAIGDFFSWFVGKTDLHLKKSDYAALIAEYFGIDLLKAGQERFAMFVEQYKKTKK